MPDQDRAPGASPARTPPTNADVARHMAAFADALAEHDHLPVLFAVHLNASGRVHAFPSNFSVGGQREIAEWAKAFGAEVELDLRLAAPYIRTSVVLRDIDVRLSSDLEFKDAARYGEALGVSVKQGTRVRVDAAALLGLLAVTA